jgi:23S rRNA (adenine2503-C2)-methyltransferase
MDAAVQLLRGKYGVLNIIPYNSVDGDHYQRPSAARIQEIKRYLHDNGVLTKVRDSAGQDIDGGCGQLRARAADVIDHSRLLRHKRSDQARQAD